jgi:hypothetical protein
MTKWITAILAAVTIGAATLMAASIENLNGQSCGDALGSWHFVNNQTGGTQTPGTLIAVFGTGTCTVTANKVLANTQHFDCVGFGGDLISASTNLAGRLVLSDFSCDEKKECDPKVEKCP